MLLGKNGGRKAGECQPLFQLGRAHFPLGAEVACLHISIPKVAETSKTMTHSP